MTLTEEFLQECLFQISYECIQFQRIIDIGKRSQVLIKLILMRYSNYNST